MLRFTIKFEYGKEYFKQKAVANLVIPSIMARC